MEFPFLARENTRPFAFGFHEVTVPSEILMDAILFLVVPPVIVPNESVPPIFTKQPPTYAVVSLMMIL
jgi:hypothetical protein